MKLVSLEMQEWQEHFDLESHEYAFALESPFVFGHVDHVSRIEQGSMLLEQDLVKSF